MAGVFGVTPMQPYPSWAQGLEQGTGAIANAIMQRRMLDLERQKFGLQQAEAGYVPAHTEYQPKPGTLSAPSMTQVGNVPVPQLGATQAAPGGIRSAPPQPSASQMGAPGQIFRGVSGQTVTDQLPGSTPVNIPGHYDLTKSLAYQTSLARVLEMQQRGVEAAKIGAASRETVAGLNDATRAGISNNINGYIGPDGQYHAGVGVLGGEALSGFNNGQWVTDPQTGERTFVPGVVTGGRLAVQAPRLATQQAIAGQANATRQGNLSERQRHDLATENIGQQGVDIRATTANNRTGQLGNLTPAEAHAWQSAYGNASYLGLPPDSAEARANTAVAALRRTTGPTTRPAAVSGPAIAPTVPRSGAEASGLRPGGVHGANAPTKRLGNRQVPDQSTSTRPTAGVLPKSPSDATVPASTQRISKADIDAAYTRALANGWTPADAAAKRDSMYTANGIPIGQ